MRVVEKVLVVLLALLWLAATNHCRSELIPGLSFFACCEQGDGAPTQDKDCETDGCAAVESGFYKMEDGLTSVSAPPLAALTLLLPLLSLPVPPASIVTLDAVP